MFKKLLSNIILILSLFIVSISSNVNAQQIVFTETFNAPQTPQNPAFTTSGQIGTSKWAVTRSGNDFGAKIDQGFLTLTNDVGSIGNVKGWVLASTPTSNYLPAYNPILSQNPGIVSWTFNMRQLRTNPSGLTDGKYGVGFVLAGSAGSSGNTGKGYAIMLGNPGMADPIRLATYNNGVQTYFTKLNSNTSGLSDFGREYTSIRVEYNPINNEWSLYVRKDNSNSFNDPKSGTLVYQGKIANADFVNESLTMMGAYWNAPIGAKQTSFFDNISVSVVTPEIISINPDSKIANSGAFTLTIDGKGFTNSSKVYWNGSSRTTTYISPTQISASIPGTDLPAPGMVSITLRNGSYISNAVDFEIESSGVPLLTLSKTILPFISTVQGTASATTETYTISGTNLTASATLTAPVNFELSVNNGTYADVLTLANSGGILLNQALTIKARLKSTAPAGNYSGNITHTTTGALTTKVVGLSGRVLAIEPTANATLPTFTNITSTGFKLNWTNSGNGDQRIVLIKQETAVTGVPVDATTYNANASFAIGSEIGTANYVVYKGTANSVQITGLEPNKIYHISIIEFNGLPGTENYRSTGLVGSATTLNSPAGLQVKVANTSYKIDFDNTVDGVNLDTFQGAGISKIAEPGQLDSDSWAFTGFSGGTINFGGESLEDSSYENGTSDGNEGDTGLYAFNVGTALEENYTLGIQPGGTDFNPGTVTLKIQNQNATAVSSLNIGYKVYVYNDQAASSKIAFNYSSDQTGTTGFSTANASLDVISPASADLAPGWKAYYRVATITGLNIAKDKFFYIRWTGSNVSGTGAKDEFAIDDIEVIANPTTNTVAFNGIAEDFVLQGNANLSDDLSVQNRLVFNGGKLAINNNTFTVAGLVKNTTPEGLTGGATSKLIVKGTENPTLSFDQTTLGTTNIFDSLSLLGSNPNLVTISNAFTVNELLKVDELQTLELGTTPLLGSLNSIQNNGTIVTQNTSSTPFPADKIWNGIGVLKMNATSTVQTLVAGTYNNLTLSSPAGTTASTNVTVNGILDLPSANANTTTGSLNMSGISELTMGNNGTNTGVGEVTGIIKRVAFSDNKLLTFGHPNSSITFPTGGVLPTELKLKVVIGNAPSWRPGGIKRYYDVSQVGGNATKAIIRQHYLTSELNDNTPERLVNFVHLTAPISPQPADMELGRSSLNLVENWVEISNANFGIFFGPDLGQAFIILDESQATVLVWNGSESTDWETTANWTPNGLPTSITKNIIPAKRFNGSPLANIVQLAPTSNVGSLIIEAGAIVNSPDGAVLTVHEGGGAWQNAGTFNPGSGTSNVVFNNLDATISGSTTFNNLTIATGGGLRALDGNEMKVAGALVNNGIMFTTLNPNTIEFTGTGQTIPKVNGLEFGGYHNLIISGSGAAFEAGYSNINVRGSLTLKSTVNFAGRTINLVGVSDQTIAGVELVDITFNDLIVNKPTGAVLLEKDIAIGGSLSITSGNLVLGSKNLTLGSNPVLGNIVLPSFGKNNMIVADGSGEVRRSFSSTGEYFFPIGELTSSPSYSPINVNITEGSFSNAYIGVNVVDAIHPNNKSSQNYISRYWNVTQVGITNAKANITGNYVAAENLFPQASMAAGQLDGEFNIESNPWKKVGSLNGTTLSAVNVKLTNNQKSVFTGIKGGIFSVEVEGYGDFCIGSVHTMNAVTSGGDAPFNYTWTPSLTNSDMVTIPTSTVGTTNYTLTVTDANGFVAIDNDSPVKILPASVGGIILNATQQICAGTSPSDLVLDGSIGSVMYWQKSTVADFTSFENLSNFTTTLSQTDMEPLTETTYFRAVLQSGNCGEEFSTVATITIKSTTWNGNNWSDGLPTTTTSAIFTGAFTATESIEACTILVTNGAAVIIPANYDVTLNGVITVESGSFKMKSNTNLIQLTDVENSGNISVERESSKLFRFDYTQWGSPVTGTQTLKQFSPQTFSNRFYGYNSIKNLFEAIINPEATVFTAAKGYLIRMPDNHISFGGVNQAQTWPGTFTGVPNNGLINVSLDAQGAAYNMLANPYPSMINANQFITDNSAEIDGTLYFWRRRNAVPTGTEGTTAYYATYTSAGGAGTGPSDSSPQGPNGFIQVGQGFLVRKIAGGSGKAKFTNAMRTNSNNANQFFRTVNKDKRSRIWLNVTNVIGEFGQTLIAYMPSADNGVDSSDGNYINDGTTALTSWLANAEYIIQGRAPFTDSDVVPLNFKTANAGSYTIAIDHVDGLFTGEQDIFLRDNLTSVTHNLKTSAYTFTTQAGSFNSRFEIIYINTTLSTENPLFDLNSIVLYKQENRLIINSGKVVIDHVEVFDISGKLLIETKKINSNKVSINVGQTNQILIVKITSTEGVTVNMKTIN